MLPLEKQAGHIVHGHDIGFDHKQRDPVQRNVHQVRRKPMQENRKRRMIQKALIGARIRGVVKILRQAGQRAHIGRRIDQSISIGFVDLSQGVDQTSDVGADAEILNAPGIENDVQRHSRPERVRASRRIGGTAR